VTGAETAALVAHSKRATPRLPAAPPSHPDPLGDLRHRSVGDCVRGSPRWCPSPSSPADLWIREPGSSVSAKRAPCLALRLPARPHAALRRRLDGRAEPVM